MEPTNQFTYLSPEKIGPAFIATALKKAAMPFGPFFLYAVLGGAFIALGGLFSLLVAGGVPGLATHYPGLVKLLAGALFPLGLMLVVVAGGGLFTSDLATLPYAYWQKHLTAKELMRVAGWGYLANFVGAVLVAWLLAYQTGTLTKEPWASFVKQLALSKTTASFWVVFSKGIGANLMVCLAVWMAAAARDVSSKVLLLWIPVMAFVTLGWEHSVANMFFLPLGMMLGAPISVEAMLIQNLLPATLGNLVGGMIFVALPYYLLWGSADRMISPSSSRTNQQEPEKTTTSPEVDNHSINHLN